MGFRRGGRGLAALAALSIVAAACGGGREEGGTTASESGQPADPGITETEVKLGQSIPFSGPGSAYGTLAKSSNAYFRMTNEEKGGVDGRKINLVSIDDGWESPRTVQNVNRLVQQEQVFALYQILGTAPNTAIWDFVTQNKVPHVYLATGSSKWGADIKAKPWSTGGQPAYTTESAIYAEFIKEIKPGAKVGMLYQNDDFGKDLLVGFEEAIKGTDIKLTSKQPYNLTDPTVDAQVTALSQAGVDVFMNYGQAKQATQAIKKAAEVGWKPIQFLGSFAGSIKSTIEPAGIQNAQNIYIGQYLKDPTDPQWANDAGVLEYRRILEKYGDGANPADGLNMAGINNASLMVKAIDEMKAPTRQALMDSIRSLETETPYMLPGIKVKWTPEDGYGFEAMQIAQFKGDRFNLLGKTYDYEGRTPIPPPA